MGTNEPQETIEYKGYTLVLSNYTHNNYMYYHESDIKLWWGSRDTIKHWKLEVDKLTHKQEFDVKFEEWLNG